MGETIKLEIYVRAFIRQETSKRWSAICPSLGVASQGKNKEDARRCLDEAVHAWFESCIERGVLDEVIRETAFRPSPHGQLLPEGSEHVKIDRQIDDEDDDVRGDAFRIHVEIPAYQAAAIMSGSGAM